MVGLGLLLTHTFQNGALSRWDEHVNTWFAAQRSQAGNSITSVATTIGSTPTVLIVAALSVVVLAVRRLWREAALVVVALSVEVLVFLMTTVLVDRPRPAVPRLDAAPPTSSFPSGHTAAAIALWVSLAIVISLHIRNAFARAVAWVVAVVVPLFVGISRLYRGMHHPTDVIASVLLGIGAVMIALLAVRVACTEHEAGRALSDLELPEPSAAAEVAP
jgi:undecaprenyl-diphosphatase